MIPSGFVSSSKLVTALAADWAYLEQGPDVWRVRLG